MSSTASRRGRPATGPRFKRCGCTRTNNDWEDAVNRREFVTGLVALPALVRPAAAEVSSIKLGKQYGLPFLPQMVMEEQKLIEQHAQRLGVNGLTVGWQTMGGPGALNDGLLSGQIQFVNVASPLLATLWDKTFGSPQEVRAVCTVQSMPYVLTTRNPNVKTIADFSASDRIAVPTVKIFGQAMALQMAAAKLWGFEKYDKTRRVHGDHGTSRRHAVDADGPDGQQPFRRGAVQLLRTQKSEHSYRAQKLRHRRQTHQRHSGHNQDLPRRQSKDLHGGARIARGSQCVHQARAEGRRANLPETHQ